MPIYEYRCQDCGRKNSVFVRSVNSEIGELTCSRCQGHNLRRLFSRFAVGRSSTEDATALYDMDKMMDGLDEDDPRSMARWAKKMSRELGEDFGDDFNESMERIEGGEDPDKVLDASD